MLLCIILLWSLQRKTLYGCSDLLFDWNYLLVKKRVEKKSLLLSFQWETKKKEFSCLCYRGRRFFTGSGAPLCYSNGSPSITTTTDCTHWSWQLIFYCRFGWRSNRQTLVAVCVLLVLSTLLKSYINLLDNNFFTSYSYAPIEGVLLGFI